MWLYLPKGLTESPFVPERAAWSSDSMSPCPDTELFVLSSGTHMLRPLSWPGWKTRPWIKRLSGLTCAPSTAERGVAAWISSLRATRASRSVSRAKGLARPPPGTFGQTSPGSSEKSARSGSSAKTSWGTFIWDSQRSPATLKAWATALQRACFQREKSALATTGVDSSSWPTPTVAWFKYEHGVTVGEGRLKFEGKHQVCIGGAAIAWTRFWELLHSTLGPELVRLRAICPSSPPVQVTLRPGPTCSCAALTLNPRFLEMLMGWPLGWTDNDSPVMGFAPWLRRMRSELSRLC